ncbi:MAG: hypothetical protein R3F60_10970 [bacterium]
MSVLHPTSEADWACDPAHQVPRLDFEFSAACDHACGHCYNVWNASPGDAQAGYPRASSPPTPTAP